MGGKKKHKIKDSEDQKELAKIAKEKWETYNERFVPIENQWMQDIDTFNKASAYEQAGGVANANVQSAYGEALKDQMSQGGNASRLSSGIDQMAVSESNDRSDNINRMQVGQQDRRVQGLQAVNAVGQGKEAQAISGLSDSARISDQHAQEQARKSFSSNQANKEMIGAGVGAATRWGIS